MGTNIRANLSKKNAYWIDKERYYELKHFCLQYAAWKSAYLNADALHRTYGMRERLSKTNRVIDVTAQCAEEKAYFMDRMKMIQDCCQKADPELAMYLFKAVTSNLGYTYLKTKLDIPCSKETYYDRYRKFFWHLSQVRK